MSMAAAGGSPASRGGEVTVDRTLAAAAMSPELRTFEQRFGDRCPFCNRTWGDPTPCDTEPKIPIRVMLGSLFSRPPRPVRERKRQSGNRHAWIEKHCEWCAQPYQTQKKGQKFCSVSHGNMARARREEQAA